MDEPKIENLWGKCDAENLAKIFVAAQSEPLPTLASLTWTLITILDDRLGEKLESDKVTQRLLKDIRCSIDDLKKVAGDLKNVVEESRY